MIDVAFSVQEANVKLEKVGYVPFLESSYPRLDMLQRCASRNICTLNIWPVPG